ncbi:unnamed protein product [Caenorhabditis sp. 36 PRJEB53466]|nr:unnamed protein product [Caenorhabditis sp. 36 PRJEB53466]
MDLRVFCQSARPPEQASRQKHCYENWLTPHLLNTFQPIESVASTNRRVLSSEYHSSTPSTSNLLNYPTATMSSTGQKKVSNNAVAATTYFKPAPSEIAWGKMRFLITDRPSNASIQSYIEELEKHGARAVVRVCESTYDTKALKEAGIDVIDLQFSDGSAPTPEVIESWFELCKTSFKEHPDKSIAVHCVAGLGRAPVLVGIALIEAGMKYEDAVEMIRHERRGALNHKQLKFLETYKTNGDLRRFRGSLDGRQRSCCIQ